MNADHKTNLINSIRFELMDQVSPEILKQITNVITVKLNDYEVSAKCTDLVVVETESQQIISIYLATKKLEGRSPKTLQSYGRRLSELLDIVGKPVTEMNVYDLRMYLAKKQMDGCSERTVSGYRSVLVSFFNWAYAERMIPDNPCLNLGIIKYKREVKKPFSKVELEKLREHCGCIRNRAIIETLLATGCRISELTGIKVNDIDFDNMEIKVLGKGNKERMVYIDPVTVMWIKKYLDSKKTSTEYLFTAKGREQFTAGGIRFMLKKIESLCGVENVHPHRFRRTMATTLIERGMSIQEVAAILGHENINTTMTYVYMNDQRVKAAYQKWSA